MSTDAESHDDVVGLFKRLGRRADTGQYHEFSPPAITPQAPAAAAQPPATLAVTPTPADTVVPPAPVATPPLPGVAPPLTAEAPEAPDRHDAADAAFSPTPLAALFARLARVPLPESAQSPLAQLRNR